MSNKFKLSSPNGSLTITEESEPDLFSLLRSLKRRGLFVGHVTHIYNAESGTYRWDLHHQVNLGHREYPCQVYSAAVA